MSKSQKPYLKQAPRLIRSKTGEILDLSRASQAGDLLVRVPLNKIQSNPKQPRRVRDDESFSSLAESVKKHGILEPLVARQETDHTYTLIAGHRRYDAARELGLRDVPLVLRQATDENLMLLALVENVQRQNLHPVDMVRALDHLAETLGGQKQAAEAVGISYDAVRQWLRAKNLGEDVLNELSKLSDVSRNDLLRLLDLSEQERLEAVKKRTQADPVSEPVAQPAVVTNGKTTLLIKRNGEKAIRVNIRFYDGSEGTLDQIEAALREALKQVLREKKKK